MVRHAKKITFEKISQLWETSPLNVDNSPLALRTFHNHRDAIEHLFGIRILCDRSDHNQYYVADDDTLDTTRLKVWMLQTLSLSNTINKADSVENRIVLDITPEEKFGLMTVIDAMKCGKVININYSIPTSDNKTSLEIAPYCVRFWRSGWYIIGKDIETGKMHAFDLVRVISIAETQHTFEYPDNFSPADFLKKYYGVDIDTNIPVEDIQIKVFGKIRDKIRTLPFHVSQKEVMSAKDYSIFEYQLVPSEDFCEAVLSYGTGMEIISPESLRTRIARQVRDMARMYDSTLESTQS